MLVRPADPPARLLRFWLAALDHAAIDIADTALLWAEGTPPEGTNYAQTWRRDEQVHRPPGLEPGAELREWANDAVVRLRRRVFVHVGVDDEALAGLLRHELEHTHQFEAWGRELGDLHDDADNRLVECGMRTGRPYNKMPMEADANAAASFFLRGLFGQGRLDELVAKSHGAAQLFRLRDAPEPIETLVDRMREFIAHIDDDFVDRLEREPPGAPWRP